MNQTELQVIEQRLDTLRGDDLFDMRRSRTLMYGQDKGGTIRHTYVDGGSCIRVVVYAPYSFAGQRDAGWAILAEHCQETCCNQDYAPTATVATSLTDYEFACRMMEAGVPLTFDHKPTADGRQSVLLLPFLQSTRRFEPLVLDGVEAGVATIALSGRAGYYKDADGQVHVLCEDVLVARQLLAALPSSARARELEAECAA